MTKNHLIALAAAYTGPVTKIPEGASGIPCDELGNPLTPPCRRPRVGRKQRTEFKAKDALIADLQRAGTFDHLFR